MTTQDRFAALHEHYWHSDVESYSLTDDVNVVVAIYRDPRNPDARPTMRLRWDGSKWACAERQQD